MNDLLTELPKHDHWNRRLFAQIVALHGLPNSYLDVGCGTGAMVKMAKRMGIDARGLDKIPSDVDYIHEHDLTKPFSLTQEFNLITCIEVAEHINKKYADVLVGSICQHMTQGSILVWSAATPGQNGIGHVNCQLGSWWRDKFAARGLNYREDFTLRMKFVLSVLMSPSRDLWHSNVQVFES